MNDLGVAVLYTSLGELPELQVNWHPLRAGQELPPAPLLYYFAEDRAQRVMATLASYAFTRHTRKLWNADTHERLMRRLNAFAQVEINLWQFAADAGHTEPPPDAPKPARTKPEAMTKTKAKAKAKSKSKAKSNPKTKSKS